MDDNKYGAKWKKKPAHAASFPPSTFKAEKYHSFDYDFGNSPSIREDKISDLSVSSAKHFRDLTAADEYSHVYFDQERCHSFNEMATPDGMFSPPDWSFLGMEDSQDSTSLLSEESFSSSAVRGERSFHFGYHPVNLKKGKFTHEQKKYDLVGGFSPDKTDHAGFKEFLHEQKIGAEKYRYMADEWNSKAGHFSKHKSAFQEKLEPDHVSFWKEEHTSASMASAPSFFDGNFMEMDNESFSDKLMSEDDLFNSFPVPEPCPKTKSTYEGSTLKNHMNQNFIYENEKWKKFSGVDIPSPVAFPWETEDNFLNSSSPKDFDRDYQFPRLSKQQNIFEDNKVEYRRTPEKPQNKDSDEKNSLSSNGRTGDVADNKKNCCENVGLKDENQELFDGPQTRNPSVGTEEEAPAAMEEVSSQLESSIDDKLNRHFDNHAPVPSQVPTKDFAHESFESDSKNAGIKGCHKGDASYQVMLESYVFQLLCVQKVLLGASEKDIKKKVG
ncbi:uncharacterized protein LOC109843774 isoform X2 [Asparagus officinalis]|uniref:uncharacterized protein LOC109843774 isoform X2 n=1 Tax=Asparagus officinalis TaxID=4686 RepID=UPI00098E2A2C|nr:uncharacterized protein LOC109843774 isoform X2 [Asparagus officinalis]